MTPQQALDFLVQLASAANAPLQVHMQARQAYELLKQLLPEKEVK